MSRGRPIILLLVAIVLPSAARVEHGAPPFQAQRFDVRQSAHFILAAPRGEDPGRVLNELESAYREVREFGLEIPSKIRVRAYGSTREFTKGAGTASFNLALFRSGTIHLQPVRLLTRRGDLRRALVHEISHTGLVDAARNGLPLWLNEGTAMNVAGERPPARKKFKGLGELEDTLRRSRRYQTLRGAYGTAAKVTGMLIAEIGRPGLLALVRAVAAGEEFEQRFRQSTGVGSREWGARALK